MQNQLPLIERIQLLLKTVSFVYKQSPWLAASRDFAAIISTGMNMFVIWIGGHFIDSLADIFANYSTYDWDLFFQSEAFIYLSYTLAAWIIANSLNSFRDYIRFKLERQTALAAENAILGKVAHENLQEVEQRRFQELLTFVPGFSIERLFSTYDMFSSATNSLITAVASLSILGVEMGWTVLFLPLISFIEPAIEYLGEKKLNHYRHEKIDDTKYLDYLWSQALTILNFPELKVDGIMKFIKKEYGKEKKEYYQGAFGIFKHLKIDKAFFGMTGQIWMYIYQVYVLITSVKKGLTLGDFTALYSYVTTGYDSSYQAWRSGTEIFVNLSYVEKFFEFVEYEGFGDIDVGERKLPRNETPTLKLMKLDFAYPDESDKKVLENVDIEIQPGEKVALIGGDGSGKSSIVKTLCGLYEIVAGDYMMGQYSVRELARGELKSKISVVFQDFVRYSMSIKRNITMSAEKVQINKSLYEKVKKVTGVNEFMKAEGLNDESLLGKDFSGGKEISPGYWQRLAIARMLYRDRPINIMDEPFTYIDGPSRVKILDGIFKFFGDEKTLIYVTQDTDHLNKFDRIFFFKGGKIVEAGSYKDLIKKKGAFYKEVKQNV